MFALTYVLMTACSQADGGASDGGDVPVGEADAGTSANNACNELTYELFGQAYLESYCVSCHGSPVVQNGVRLDSLANVIKNKKKARSEVTSKGMPPRGATAPSSAERAMFAQWIDCGPL